MLALPGHNSRPDPIRLDPIRLRADLRARGLSVSTPDAHVAQCALDVDGLLLTEDTIFGKIGCVAPLRRAGADEDSA